jgi:hypothetical protein
VLASSFSHLDFFTHVLELLLHDILENEADNAPPEEGTFHDFDSLACRSAATSTGSALRTVPS